MLSVVLGHQITRNNDCFVKSLSFGVDSQAMGDKKHRISTLSCYVKIHKHMPLAWHQVAAEAAGAEQLLKDRQERPGGKC